MWFLVAKVFLCQAVDNQQALVKMAILVPKDVVKLGPSDHMTWLASLTGYKALEVQSAGFEDPGTSCQRFDGNPSIISATRFPTNGLNRLGSRHNQIKTTVLTVQAYVESSGTPNILPQWSSNFVTKSVPHNSNRGMLKHLIGSTSFWLSSKQYGW